MVRIASVLGAFALAVSGSAIRKDLDLAKFDKWLLLNRAINPVSTQTVSTQPQPQMTAEVVDVWQPDEENYCTNSCGTKNHDFNCWCDQNCLIRGDCCPGAQQECGISTPPQLTLADASRGVQNVPFSEFAMRPSPAMPSAVSYASSAMRSYPSPVMSSAMPSRHSSSLPSRHSSGLRSYPSSATRSYPSSGLRSRQSSGFTSRQSSGLRSRHSSGMSSYPASATRPYPSSAMPFRRGGF